MVYYVRVESLFEITVRFVELCFSAQGRETKIWKCSQHNPFLVRVWLRIWLRQCRKHSCMNCFHMLNIH